jgi:hypothetical protein
MKRLFQPDCKDAGFHYELEEDQFELLTEKYRSTPPKTEGQELLVRLADIWSNAMDNSSYYDTGWRRAKYIGPGCRPYARPEVPGSDWEVFPTGMTGWLCFPELCKKFDFEKKAAS